MIELGFDIFQVISLSLLLDFPDWPLEFPTIFSLTCSCNMTCMSTSHLSNCWDRASFCWTDSINCELTCVINNDSLSPYLDPNPTCMPSILPLASSTSATFFLATAASLLLQALLIRVSLLRLISSTSFFRISLSSSAA